MPEDDAVYRITEHARRRIRQRNLEVDGLYAALFEGRTAWRRANRELRFDRFSRCAVVVDPRSRVVVTAFRMTRYQLEKHLRRKDRRSYG